MVPVNWCRQVFKGQEESRSKPVKFLRTAWAVWQLLFEDHQSLLSTFH